jgi:hypothetical protein
MELNPQRSDAVRIRKLMKLAEALGVTTDEPETLSEAHKLVCDELYRRLVESGHVSAEGSTPKPFHDVRNDVRVIITRRQNATVLDTRVAGQSGSYAILYAAQCALPDITSLLENWDK